MDLHSHKLFQSFLVFLSFLPYISYIMFTLWCMIFVSQIDVVKNVRYNRKIVPNPFERMIYANSLNLSGMNTYIKFSAYHELASFIGIAESAEEASLLLAQAENRIAQGESVTLMLYKDAFRNQEKNVLKGMCRHITRTVFMILISLFFVFISSVFTVTVLIYHFG
jgi:hypothetical protein